jgi:hypothetical protein
MAKDCMVSGPLGAAKRVGLSLSVAGLLLGCSAGGTGTSRDQAPPEPTRGAREPVDVGSPSTPPVLSAPVESTPVDFIGDSEVPMNMPSGDAPLRRRGLLQRQTTCPEGGTTSVSGTVYIPSGKLPLYNAMVYVPDADLRPLTPGPSCNCEITGEPIASALTDANGRFVIENVPVGANVPLVIQVGDWRREFNIGTVEACKDNAVADQTLRLPARRSEGDIPKIAVATGLVDALECLVRKLGIDESEFTVEQGGGRVTLFAGEGGTQRYAINGRAAFPRAEQLWSDVESLSQYDVVLMSCDGDRDNLDNKDRESLDAMFEYLNRGGRVFGSHYQAVWFSQGPAPFPALAEFENQSDLGTVSGRVVTSFPKGQALSDWLANAGASPQRGLVEIRGAQHYLRGENPQYAQRWIATEEEGEEAAVQYISANTPLGVSESNQCGRVVLSDIHVSPGRAGDDISDASAKYDFPNGCVTSEFSPQEAVLAFMMFDISACIVPDDVAPVAPPIILR